jgi:hypothetical protein
LIYKISYALFITATTQMRFYFGKYMTLSRCTNLGSSE